MASSQLRFWTSRAIHLREDTAEACIVRRTPERERPDEDVARDGAQLDEEQKHLGAEQGEVEQGEVRFWVRGSEEGQRVVRCRHF